MADEDVGTVVEQGTTSVVIFFWLVSLGRWIFVILKDVNQSL